MVATTRAVEKDGNKSILLLPYKVGCAWGAAVPAASSAKVPALASTTSETGQSAAGVAATLSVVMRCRSRHTEKSKLFSV